jgi:hypothetical protein
VEPRDRVQDRLDRPEGVTGKVGQLLVLRLDGRPLRPEPSGGHGLRRGCRPSTSDSWRIGLSFPHRSLAPTLRQAAVSRAATSPPASSRLRTALNSA